MAGSVTVWPRLAEAAQCGVDEPRVCRRQNRLVPQAKTIHHPGPKALDQHVGAFDQSQQHVATSGGLEVQGQAAFIPVDEQEYGAAVALARRIVPRRIAAVRVFDLDHVSAQVGQQHRAERPRQQPREVEDTQALEGGHRRSGCGTARATVAIVSLATSSRRAAHFDLESAIRNCPRVPRTDQPEHG